MRARGKTSDEGTNGVDLNFKVATRARREQGALKEETIFTSRGQRTRDGATKGIFFNFATLMRLYRPVLLLLVALGAP